MLSPPPAAEHSFLLEERYQQLERNFNAVVKELQARPEGQPPQLQALLKRMDAELRHQVLRAQGAGSGTAQRLVERESILQRNFEAVVALMDGQDISAPTPTGSQDGAPMTPAAKGDSPFTQHPWQPTSSYEASGGSTPGSASHGQNDVGASPPVGTPAAVSRAGEIEASFRQQLQQREAAAAAERAAAEERAAALRQQLQQARTLSCPLPGPPGPRPRWVVDGGGLVG